MMRCVVGLRLIGLKGKSTPTGWPRNADGLGDSPPSFQQGWINKLEVCLASKADGVTVEARENKLCHGVG